MNFQKIGKMFNELSKLDVETLKDIDYIRLKDDLLKRKDIIINTVAIIGSLIAILGIYNNNKDDFTNLSQSVTSLEKKLDAKTELLKIKKEMLNYIENIPIGVPDDELISYLNKAAITSNVQITNFSPSQTKTFKYYNTTSINLEITAKSYGDMWKFIQSIESSGLALRVDKFQSGTSSRRQRRGQSKTEYVLSTRVSISSINVKNHEIN